MRVLFTVLSLPLIVAFASCSSQNDKSPYIPDMDPVELGKKMEEAGQPVDEHKAIYPLVGKWKADSKWWMAPDSDATLSEGVAQRSLVLNGLFIQEEYTDNNPKHPFKGIGMIGFDTVTDLYNYTWFDSMAPSTWLSKGIMDEGGKVIRFSGSGSCPVTGAELATRSELELVDVDTNIFRMYVPGPGGKEFQNVEITYHRVK